MPENVDIVMARGGSDTGGLTERQVQIVCVNSMLIFLSTLAVALRFVSRRVMKCRISMDDYVIVFALLLSNGHCICQIAGIRYGLGQHISQVSKQNEVKYLIMVYILQLLWNTALSAIKISILLFYRRLFPVRGLLIASSIIGAIVLAWYVVCQVIAIAQCLPIQHYWQRLGPGHCIRSSNFYIVLDSVDLATDLAILVLPIPSIWQIQIRQSRKISLSVVFSLGSMVCIASVIRLETEIGVDVHDITWSNAHPALWTAIETSLAIVAACLPSLGPILHKIIGRSLSTISDTAMQRTLAIPNIRLRHANMGDFERIFESGPQGRDEASIMNAIIGRCEADLTVGEMATDYEEMTQREGCSEATKRGQIMVRISIKQDVEQRIE